MEAVDAATRLLVALGGAQAIIDRRRLSGADDFAAIARAVALDARNMGIATTEEAARVLASACASWHRAGGRRRRWRSSPRGPCDARWNGPTPCWSASPSWRVRRASSPPPLRWPPPWTPTGTTRSAAFGGQHDHLRA